jgi:selenocysteine lyase/cysteine desulfurase
VPGGGTVAYVGPDGHRYLDDPVAREEGGTPAIVESIRAGLVFQLKQAVGTDLIHEREQRFLRRALDRWRANPNLELLGNLDVPRLPIVSFRIRHGDHLLHHELVVALLNDLFGIQARAAARAPGPYGHRLLGDYAFDPRTGQWRHHRAPAGYLEAARELLAAGPTAVAAAAAGAGSGTGDGGPSWLPPELERLRDFSLPPLPV